MLTHVRALQRIPYRAHTRRKRHVLDTEVYHCLRKGKILLEPEEDIKTGHLICRMECYGAGRNLAVCVALDEADPDLIVVTVIPK